MTRIACVNIAVVLAAAIMLGGDRPDALAQQHDQAAQYRATTLALFKELMDLKRREIIVPSIFTGGGWERGFGAGNPQAHDWLQRVRRHVRQAPPGTRCWEADQPLGLFLSVCDSELLNFLAPEEFTTTATRFWLLTICTENPEGCRP